MTANAPSQQNRPIKYPIYTVRWLSIHALGVPSVWFLGAIGSMQFIRRETSLPDNLSVLGLDTRLVLVLLPLVFSLVWNVINYGKPTLGEIQRVLRGEEL